MYNYQCQNYPYDNYCQEDFEVKYLPVVVEYILSVEDPSVTSDGDISYTLLIKLEQPYKIGYTIPVPDYHRVSLDQLMRARLKLLSSSNKYPDLRYCVDLYKQTSEITSFVSKQIWVIPYKQPDLKQIEYVYKVNNTYSLPSNCYDVITLSDYFVYNSEKNELEFTTLAVEDESYIVEYQPGISIKDIKVY